jgi:lipoprotein-releasing system ATP-binding protein
VAEQVLRLEGVRKSYGVGTAVVTEVLHGISLALEHGEFTALIGPSGSGKSTLLNIIGLLDRPSGGTLYLAGRDTSTLPESDLTRLRGSSVGFVFQYHHLLSAFTAFENVMMPLLLQRGHPDEAMRRAAHGLLQRVGLTQWEHHLANNMSGGQQQRVAIARALATNPTLILADEPTGNLDTESANGVFGLLREVSAASGTTVLLVTHNMNLASRCDRIIELVDGRLVGDQPRQAPGTAPA